MSDVVKLSCVNCDGPVEGTKLFCSALCNQMAKTVRYVRGVRADGRIEQPDIAEAVRIRLASVLGGGYPEQARRLNPEQRQAVFERDQWECQACGAKAEEIDHVDPRAPELNVLENLQALCSACHRKKTIANHRPIATEEERERARVLRLRIEAPVPVRRCDSRDWAQIWRQIKAERRRAIAAGDGERSGTKTISRPSYRRQG